MIDIQSAVHDRTKRRFNLSLMLAMVAHVAFLAGFGMVATMTPNKIDTSRFEPLHVTVIPEIDASIGVLSLSTTKQATDGFGASPESTYFLSHIEKQIETTGNTYFPQDLLAQKLGGSVTVRLRIHPDGRLLALHILTSSGIPLVDNAALAIVKKSLPFPTLPEASRPLYPIEMTRAFHFRTG